MGGAPFGQSSSAIRGSSPLPYRNVPASHQHSGLDQIDDFRYHISWLIEANLPLPDEKWLKFEAWFGQCSCPFRARPLRQALGRTNTHSRREKVAIYMLFQKRVCLNDDFVLVTGVVWSGPPILWGVVTNRLEKGTFMQQRVLKIPGFLTSSGRAWVWQNG